MDIAFLIIANHRPAQLARLCDRLQGHDVYIHLDAKVDIAPFLNELNGRKVRFISNRVSVSWGGYSMVEATTRLIDFALSLRADYCKLVLLSGTCYPIKPISELAEKFAADDGLNYISAAGIHPSDAALYKLISRHWFHDGILPAAAKASYPRLDRFIGRVASKLSSYFPRQVLNELGGLKPCFGSQWWALSAECATHVLEQLRSNQRLVRFYATVYAPDEHVIQTLVANSSFPWRSVAPALTEGASMNRYAPLHWIHPSAAREFTDQDSVEKLTSIPQFFIRKISSNASQLLDAIDNELLRQRPR